MPNSGAYKDEPWRQVAFIEFIEKRGTCHANHHTIIILKSIETSRKWVSRYALRELSSDKVFRLKELIELQSNDIFEKFSLDEQVLNQLRNNFLSPLSKEKDFPYKDILSEYTLSIASLERVVTNTSCTLNGEIIYRERK